MRGLLRICTAGSVDDGKSTLIGRLLFDARGVYENQVHSVTRASRNRAAGPIDFSLSTDGLKTEREQGITIDVAYRDFATPYRKFADAAERLARAAREAGSEAQAAEVVRRLLEELLA